MKQQKRFLFILIVSAVLLSISLYPQHPPRRVISLGPSITESIYLLGAQDQLVGCTVYCKRPPEALKKERVGTAVKADMEKVMTLRPDLVLAISLTDPKTIGKLKKVGLKVEHFPQPRDFNQLCHQFLRLGKLVGKETKARQIVQKARRGVIAIQEKVKHLKKPRVFFQLGARPLFAVTGKSFTHDFIHFAGGENIVANESRGLISREEVLRRNPEVIIIVTMGITGEKEKETWETYKTIEAVKQGRIFIVDSNNYCSPTPATFVQSLQEMLTFLHPTPKKQSESKPQTSQVTQSRAYRGARGSLPLARREAPRRAAGGTKATK